nr:ATP-binding domain-containing protein [Methylosinus sp. PW1]
MLKVVIPVTASQIMDRTMLYTAVTRAREKVVLVGSREVFRKAVVDPPSYSVRTTGMHDALRAAVQG